MNWVPERNSLQCHSLPFSHRMRLGDRKSLQVSLTSCWLRKLMRRKSLVSVTHILLLGGQNTWRSPESHCIVTYSLLIMQQGETIWKRLMHCDSQTIHGHDLLKHLVDYSAAVMPTICLSSNKIWYWRFLTLKSLQCHPQTVSHVLRFCDRKLL